MRSPDSLYTSTRNKENVMTDQNCAYCMEGDLVAAFGIKICELPSSKVYLFKEQSHRGRVIVAHKKHVSEITELTRRGACRLHRGHQPCCRGTASGIPSAESELRRLWRYRSSPALPPRSEVYGRVRVGRRLRYESAAEVPLG